MRRAPSTSGYFGEDSMLRLVQRERVVALSGPRALLMQAAHPLAVFGLLAHSSALEEPYERLARTAATMNTIAFGSRSEAGRITRRVRAMHRRVRGRLPERLGRYAPGTPYAADDPELLLWVLFTLVDSASVVYNRYVRTLSRDEQAALWEDYKLVGRLFGLDRRDMPDTLEALDAYRTRMLTGDELVVSAWARRRAREIVLSPPVPLLARPLLETLNFVTIGLLPDSIRRQYGFSALPPPLVRKVLVAGGANYLKRAVIPFLPARVRLVPSARPAQLASVSAASQERAGRPALA
jgi:uncharacterized protein (DUF2236 family)